MVWQKRLLRGAIQNNLATLAKERVRPPIVRPLPSGRVPITYVRLMG